MQLTQHTDYALRVLIHLACHPDEHVSTSAISRAYGISNHHLVKVVHRLSTAGFLRVKRGRGGGITLGRAAAEIRLGDVVRVCEPHLDVVECFDTERGSCTIAPACDLKHAFHAALQAFLGVLDDRTLADVVPDGRRAAYLERFLAPAPSSESRTAVP